MQTLLKDHETFTEQDWMYSCSIWPNLGWKIKDAEEAFKLLLQQGKVMELEGGRYKYKSHTETAKKSGGGA